MTKVRFYEQYLFYKYSDIEKNPQIFDKEWKKDVIQFLSSLFCLEMKLWNI